MLIYACFLKGRRLIKAQSSVGPGAGLDMMMDEEDEMANYDMMMLDQDEVDEVRSTAECTTNDEMELESVSAVNARRLNNTINNANSNINNTSTINVNEHDYLGVQNMEKEEILAAKINKFLSVSLI